MPTLVIVGAQWGDEAKGKIVDVLGSQADVVVRFSGGNNAGHTVILGPQTFKFHLLPAGILHPQSVGILGSGMVIDPKGLLDELDRTLALTAEIGELKISSAAHVVFPYHRLLDQMQEEARGENKIGTTSRGIGPAYEDKVSRIGIRMAEFVCPDRFARRLREVAGVKNRLLELFGQPKFDVDELHAEYSEYADRIRPYVADTDILIQDAVLSGKKVLFEGAQGTFLDLDCGTYPYVTSSHPIAGGACLGTGIGPRYLDSILGVAKAYTTRVGSGPFPTEQDNEVGVRIREQGQEFGTTTGRGRRCGWLDLVALRQSCRLNSLSGLIMTRLDVLSGIPELQVATSYRLDGQSLDHLPADVQDLARVEAVYEALEGWDGDLRSARSMHDLPASTRRYLEFVTDFCQTPLAIVSIGPDREETILTAEIWASTPR
ncbi:MAG TPA: adenylosuccinate synthase [Fimbriimonadaceae bacterium]|nr:adenylosuccinate synthase [Fimbriimonadaceae bacterium]HRJ33509.1 adenylosuccinate synthase [Fimbriimonadaceae bacterium]